MAYIHVFDPARSSCLDEAALQKARTEFGDRRDGKRYVYSEEALLAVNAALVSGRPLLVQGPPGSGKSSLASHVARSLGWRYLEEVVTSRTQARDLMYRVDAVRRLNDAQIPHKEVLPEGAYLEPGILWWAFDPESARRRGHPDDGSIPDAVPPFDDVGKGSLDAPAVVLLDELDKADPDVPNDLLVPLGSFRFPVPGCRDLVKAARPPLLVLTSNNERELPPAFLRRCICLNLPDPDRTRLEQIAGQIFGQKQERLFKAVLDLLESVSASATLERRRRPSTPEFLDAVWACQSLGITPDGTDATWQILQALVLEKRPPASAEEGADGAAFGGGR